MDIYELDDVYGITRDLPLNYVERKCVDGKFKKNINRKKHITIFGSSKQGKTSLKKHCLKADDYINIQCDNHMTLNDIHMNILKRAGYKVEGSTKKTTSGKNKVIASIAAKLPVVGTKISTELEADEAMEKEYKGLELDPEDVNDIIEALDEIDFHKIIVLDDFHYLKNEIQQGFAFELKAFHESSKLCFVIIGVWMDENKLTVYNGDLSGRVVSINADEWDDKSLREVIRKGETLLNIKFSDSVIDSLLEKCYSNVYYVQEVCHRICDEYDIENTQEKFKIIGDECNVDKMISEVVEEVAGRYNSFITQYAAGFQDTTLEMHKWLLYPILTSKIDEISNGLKYRYLREILQANHPQKSELNPGNLTQALKSVVSLQLTKNIRPIIIDYDETNLKLHIVDKGFIIWLQTKDRRELLELAGLPVYQ